MITSESDRALLKAIRAYVRDAVREEAAKRVADGDLGDGINVATNWPDGSQKASWQVALGRVLGIPDDEAGEDEESPSPGEPRRATPEELAAARGRIIDRLMSKPEIVTITTVPREGSAD